MRKFLTALLIVFSIVVHADNKITYPERAEILRVGGEINVVYDISREGKTENIRIISVNPKYFFDRDVKRQIATWNYPKNDPQKDVALRVVFKAK
ncbi:TonB family protein [Pantoea sp. JV6]|uniref:TonB family protein n=1 Tax=Pantoea sp. JV6 TaxID=2981604 RepID=UPI0022203184|nr:TonB family protein [Pantoea sp. JV6]MCW0974350.1 TonB family protein [Pantoea sp. JV6]